MCYFQTFFPKYKLIQYQFYFISIYLLKSDIYFVLLSYHTEKVDDFIFVWATEIIFNPPS